MVFICPELGIFEGWLITSSVFVPLDTATAMVKMEMGQKNVGYIIPMEAGIF